MKKFLNFPAFKTLIDSNNFTATINDSQEDKQIEDENSIKLDNEDMTLLITKWPSDTSVHIAKYALKKENINRKANLIKDQIIEIFGVYYGQITEN